MNRISIPVYRSTLHYFSRILLLWFVLLIYYSGHHRKSADGTHRIDYFPLPGITVHGFCDVVIDLDYVTVNSKLRREAALAFTYEQLGVYEFEVFGEDDDKTSH